MKNKIDKEKVINLWRAGKSQQSIAKDMDISVGSVNKYCKGVPQDIAYLVNTKVALESSLSERNEQEVNAIHSIADETLKHLRIFRGSALQNQQLANEMLKTATTIQEIESHSRITARNKETVVGKAPETVINNSNIQQNAIEVKFV